MPTPIYMTVEGVTQGDISAGAMSPDSVGTVYQEDHEDEIQVLAVEHNIIIPRDIQSGQPSGPRMHNPIKITKRVDKSSPLLYQALVTGESLTCSIEWYRTGEDGTQEPYFIQEIEGAAVVDIKAYSPNIQDPANGPYGHLEEVSFSYSTITWTHEPGGTEGSDSWRTSGG
jgi:type VI secretion system secreted protein Hcp